jgi:hypothetical protein
LSFGNLIKDLANEKMMISNSLPFGLAKLKKTSTPQLPLHQTNSVHEGLAPLFRTSFYFGIYLLSFYFGTIIYETYFVLIMKCICLNLFASILLSFTVILLNKQALNHLLYQARQQLGSSCRYQQQHGSS